MASKTWTDFSDGTYKNPNPVKITRGGLELHRHKVDFGYKTLDAGNGDVFEVLVIPANSWVLNAWIRVISKCPTNSTVHLGYGSDANCWGHALPLDTVGAVVQKVPEEDAGQTMIYQDRAPIANVPRYFAASDTIDIKGTTNKGDVNVSAGVIEVCALIFRE